MSSFESLWRELTAQVAQLDNFAAQKFVNRAYQDIRESHDWTFLMSRTSLSAPQMITTGSVDATQFSQTVTFNAAAAAVLDAVTLDIPLTSRQLKISGGPPYDILSYTPGGGGPSSATIAVPGTTDVGYQEATRTGSAYAVIKCYYDPPTDFLRWKSVVNYTSKYRFWLHVQQQVLDLADPGRIITGLPYILADCIERIVLDGNGVIIGHTPRFEMWPHPTYAQGFAALYQKRGVNFANNAEMLPTCIPDDLLLLRAKYRAYEWANVNIGRFPTLKGTNWQAAMIAADNEYQRDLKKYIRQDRETFVQSQVIPNTMGYRPLPFDSDFLQTHAVEGWETWV